MCSLGVLCVGYSACKSAESFAICAKWSAINQFAVAVVGQIVRLLTPTPGHAIRSNTFVSDVYTTLTPFLFCFQFCQQHFKLLGLGNCSTEIASAHQLTYSFHHSGENDSGNCSTKLGKVVRCSTESHCDQSAITWPSSKQWGEATRRTDWRRARRRVR